MHPATSPIPPARNEMRTSRNCAAGSSERCPAAVFRPVTERRVLFSSESLSVMLAHRADHQRFQSVVLACGTWLLALLQDALQGCDERGALGRKLGTMVQHQVAQGPFTVWGQQHHDFASVCCTPLPFYQSPRFEPVHQLNRTVMLDLKLLGELANAGTDIRRQALQCQKHLILPGLQVSIAHHPVTKL